MSFPFYPWNHITSREAAGLTVATIMQKHQTDYEKLSILI